MKHKVLFIDTVHELLEQRLTNMGFDCVEGYSFSKAEVLKRINEYTGLVIRSRFKIDKEFIDEATQLKFICRSGSGMENIDLEYAKSKNIYCFNSPEGNRDAVGEHAIAMLLCLFNNIIRSDREVREGIWNREKNRGVELMGKTVGIIGYGVMGNAFAKRLSGFGVDVLAYDKYKSNYGNEFAKESSLEDIYQKADIVSIHLPLTQETTYYINTDFINKFSKSIYIVNTSRGKNLYTSDLVNVMKSGKVLGACLDVLEYETSSFEKIDKENLPEDFIYLSKCDNVVLSPHVAGWTKESYVKLSGFLADKVEEKLSEFLK